MKLFLDIGNTNIVIGLYNNKEVIRNWRIRANDKGTADEYKSLIESFLESEGLTFNDLDDLVISSVVPKLTQTLMWMWQLYKNEMPFIITANLETGLKINLTSPDEIGTDLLVAAVAAYNKYQTTCIIIDMGTATTVTVVNQDGGFLGGSIVTGLELTLNALIENTALLSFNKISKTEIAAIGNSTEAAIQSGIVYGYAGLIDNIVKNIIKELDTDDYKVITTGGQALVIAEFSEYITEIEPNLLFEGMHIIYQLNQK